MSATKFTRMPTSRQMLMMGVPELPEAAFGGDVPPQQRKALVQAMGIRPQGGGGGGGLMAVVGVAAAIAIPFAAPVIAASIGTSLGISAATFGMSTMAGSIVGSAIVGAGLGAITAKVTGQDVGRGALFGGIGGGIGGYTSAANAAQAAGGTAGTAGGAATTPSAVDLTGTAVAPTGGMTAGMTQAEMLAAQEAGFGMTQQAQMLAAQDAGLGAQLSSGAGAESAYAYQAPTAGLNTTTAGAAGTTTAGTTTAPAAGGVSEQQAILNAQDAAVGATPSTSPTAVGYQANTAPSTVLGKLGEGVSKVGTELGKKFTDPKQQADLLLRAAGQMAGTYFADDLPPEQRQLLDQQRAELEQLRTTNNALFQEKLSAAQQLVGNASYFDPEYFGLQRARKTQMAGAQLERDTLSKISPQRAGLRAAEQRRLRLGTSRDVGTAYDTGFTTGVDAQNKQLTAGLNLYPSAPTSALSQGASLMSAYGSAEDRRRKSIADTSKLFGSFTG
jgi:hypothetical protein